MTGYRAPTADQVKEAMRRIPTLQLRGAFFSGLRNPLWLAPLAEAGMFANPPEPEPTGDGLVRDIYWPEIDYLKRVAPEAPNLVVDILLKLAQSTNPWVRRAVFTIAASIPADQAARLKPLLKAWLATGFGWRSDPREMVTVAVNLLEGGQASVGSWLANVLFQTSADRTRNRPSLLLEDYWYAEGLPRVAAALGPGGLRDVLQWLTAYERQCGHLTETMDVTQLSRESIRTRTDLNAHDAVEQSLIDVAADLAVKAMREDPQRAAVSLLRPNIILSRKIALYAAAEVLDSNDSTDDEAAQMVETTIGLLTDAQSLDDACRIEYAEAARALAKRVPAALTSIGEFVLVGPPIGRSGVREQLRNEGETDESLDARVDDYYDRWNHRWLSAIGPEALPADLRATLAELTARRGLVTNPLAPTSVITSWTGPNSPLSDAQMAAMSSAELVAQLESWHYSGSGWGPEPSHEGQARQLTSLLTTNPGQLSGIDNLVGRLRPTYVRSILNGWEAALKAESSLDWEQVREVLRDVLAHDDQSRFPSEGGRWDDDADYRQAKQAAVSLLEDLAKRRDAPVIPVEAMALFAELILNQGADETAWAEYDKDSADGDSDALTLSINLQWPIRVRGIVNLMGRGREMPWYDQALAAFEAELARVDLRGGSRAVVGEAIGRLFMTDPNWLKAHVRELFGGPGELSKNQQIALTTGMATHFYHPELYELLAPAMTAAMASPQPPIAGWRHNTDPLQRIGEWVINAIIAGDKTIEDPVAAAFFESVDPKVRGEAIGHMAWSMMHADAVDKDITDRFADFWDARVQHVRAHHEDGQELRGFHWFVKSGKFDATWWLPRLNDALALEPDLANERYMIGKEIASAADVDPRAALDVAKAIMAHGDEYGRRTWDLAQNALPIVLARAMGSPDERLRNDAIQLLNDLGEQGHVTLESQVESVQNGTITQDDVPD